MRLGRGQTRSVGVFPIYLTIFWPFCPAHPNKGSIGEAKEGAPAKLAIRGNLGDNDRERKTQNAKRKGALLTNVSLSAGRQSLG
jgi:hypothetical protein